MTDLYELYIALGEPEGVILHPERLDRWAASFISETFVKYYEVKCLSTPEACTGEEAEFYLFLLKHYKNE